MQRLSSAAWLPLLQSHDGSTPTGETGWLKQNMKRLESHAHRGKRGHNDAAADDDLTAACESGFKRPKS